ncbi:MAG: nucleotide pyrophosphohydrolase [Bdellovibrionales bacterium]|jgi:dCTP diphosphatase|nr:nucleotide pyrophosphohydrolase [Bdellovibrionales bacterium]MBT3525797.1 nucleotide pyrophosphohydrolase [Bdellovibrionales bacterium]MBT7668871.1 nucleotide pyrophosphohydrolase [Bdellovibrionales bacterium]MBT7765839.1 nucleotide pyrophosphohydrolase [Bdellovibrionales bacterium]
MNNQPLDLPKIIETLREFANERDWDQFHSLKNLSVALTVEASELMEHFQWLSEQQSNNLSAEQQERVSEEVADVFCYLVRFCDLAAIDLNDAFWKKHKINREKYPVELARGSAKKYTDLPSK